MRILSRPPLAAAAPSVAVAPPLGRHIEAGRVLQRLRHYPGRTLTQSALEIEQDYRDGRLGLLGRRLSAGIVAGLGLSAEPGPPAVLHLEPGRGLAGSGQDVVLHRAVSLPLDRVPVLGSEADPGVLPRGAGVLVLVPGGLRGQRHESEADRERAFRDPCPLDREALAFQRYQWQDAAWLLFVPAPPWLATADAARARNRLAWLIDDREAAEGPQALPWNAAGVPLALLDIAADGAVNFVDRHAVARRGGLPPRPVPPGAVGPELRRARLEGLLARLAELVRDGWDGTDMAARLRFLPPSGVLPRRAWEQGGCFPDTYRQAMAPIPLEQLDAALAAAAGMAPFDLDQPDIVKWLVPVPAAVFEPELLQTPALDPVFLQTRAALASRVRGALDRRGELRSMAVVVPGGLDPATVPVYGADPDALDGEEGFPPPADPEPVTDWSGQSLAVLQDFFDGLPAGLLDPAQQARLDPARFADPQSDYLGLRVFADDLAQRLDGADDTVNLGFTRLQAEIYRLRQIMLDNEESTKLATSPVLAGIARGDNSYALNQGIKAYFQAARKVPGPAGPAPASQPSPGSGLPGAVRAALRIGTPPLAAPQARALPLEPGRPDLFAAAMAEVKAGAVADLVLADAAGKRKGIARARAIPGELRDFRTLTVADRLKSSAAAEAKSGAVRSKAETVAQLQELGIFLEGLEAPMTAKGWGRGLLSGEQYDRLRQGLNVDERQLLDRRAVIVAGPTDAPPGQPGQLVLVDWTPRDQTTPDLAKVLAAVRRSRAPLNHPGLPGLILAGSFDPDPENGDEAAFLGAAVDALESAVAMLRVVEGRIEALRAVLDQALAAVERLAELGEGWETDLAGADRDLAEARHDLRVADSLIAEERRRLEELRLRRRDVIQRHVKFVAYVRPRTQSSRDARRVPSRPLAGVRQDPVLDCLVQDGDPPEELEELLEVFRDLPLAWLPAVAPLLEELDRPALLDRVYLGFRQRARLRLEVLEQRPALPAAGRPEGRLGLAYREVRRRFHQVRMALDPARAADLSWQERQRRAREELSLADLLESGARPGLVRRAQEELESLQRVATCLFQTLGRVPAAARLLWVRELSVFDKPIALGSLAVLPGWPLLDADLRGELGRLAGWLFERVDPQAGQAVGLVNDLVRVAILLSAHAPVAELVAGHVDRPQTGSVGGVVDVVIDRGRARIGMRVDVYRGAELAVSGRVRDLAGGRARVEVLRAAQAAVVLDAQARVYLASATARAGVAR